MTLVPGMRFGSLNKDWPSETVSETNNDNTTTATTTNTTTTTTTTTTIIIIMSLASETSERVNGKRSRRSSGPAGAARPLRTPSPPTKSLDFRGFDSSKLLILKGGNSHVRIIS